MNFDVEKSCTSYPNLGGGGWWGWTKSKITAAFFLRRPSLRRVIQVIQVMQVRLAHLWVYFQLNTLSLKLSTSLWRLYHLVKYDSNYGRAPKLPMLFVAISDSISIISNPSHRLNENLLCPVHNDYAPNHDDSFLHGGRCDIDHVFYFSSFSVCFCVTFCAEVCLCVSVYSSSSRVCV